MRNRLPYLLLFIMLIPCWGIGWKPGGDLGAYHGVAQFIHAGGVGTLYEESARFGNFRYGPVGLVLLEPFAFFSANGFNNFILVMQTLFYCLFWFCLFRLFPLLLKAEAKWLFIFVWVSSIKPIHASFQSHNVQILFAALLLSAELWTRSSSAAKKFLAGVLVGLLAGIKIYPLFVAIYYFLRKPKETRQGLLFGGILFFLIPIVRFGPEIGRQLPGQFLFSAVKYHQVYNLALDTVSLSLPSLLARWMPENYLQLGLIPLVVGMIASVFFLQSWLNRDEEGTEAATATWALMLAVMAMLNSTTRPDYFIYFVPAFAAVLKMIHLTKPHKGYAIGVTVSLLLIAFITEWTLGSRVLNHLLESYRVPVVGIMLLCYLLARGIRVYGPAQSAH